MAKRTQITPRRWAPQKDLGLTGSFSPTSTFVDLTILPVSGIGPEDTAIDAQGRILTGTEDGRLLRMTTDGRHLETIGHTLGRPLGIEVAPDGGIIVCDADRGLLRVTPESGEVTVLADSVSGAPLRLTNNAAVSRSGDIYFTESSTRFRLREFKADLLEHSSTGRLLKWSPTAGVEVLLTGLDFANGVALAEDESYVLVAETGGYRVRRLELTGEHAGASTIILHNMPGLPDNMSTGSNGLFWIAMPSTRNRVLDRLLPRPGFLRSAVWALPDALQPDADKITWVCAIDGTGVVVHNVFAQGDRYHYVTGVTEFAGDLYLGSLVESAVAKAPAPRN